jgi:tetratricopeptide (TPR) repeat protein
MASIRAREYAWADAERGFLRAIELNPNNALAHLELGRRVLVVQGRFDEGLEAVHRALALDPLSPYVITEAGDALVLARRYQEAVERFRQAIALDPSRNRPYNLMARALSLQGRTSEALDARDRSLKLSASLVAFDWMGCLAVRAGRREEALAVLETLRNSGRPSRALASAYACLGDRAQTLASIEEAVAKNEPRIPELLQAPELDFLRDDPRFAALLKRLNLSAAE